MRRRSRTGRGVRVEGSTVYRACCQKTRGDANLNQSVAAVAAKAGSLICAAAPLCSACSCGARRLQALCRFCSALCYKAVRGQAQLDISRGSVEEVARKAQLPRRRSCHLPTCRRGGDQLLVERLCAAPKPAGDWCLFEARTLTGRPRSRRAADLELDKSRGSTCATAYAARAGALAALPNA
eukprot:354060-Chlamydomonas_euryale.AAC.5